jgi:hypothetical protein
MMMHNLRADRREVAEFAAEAKERGREMRKQGIFFVVFFVSVVIALNSAWGQEKHFWLNKEVTAKIRALDREYFKGFDVYSAGVRGNPTALLFDIKDDYPLPSRLWGEPLSEREIIDAIYELDGQYNDNKLIPLPPRALNIVNLKGKVLGYVYTGLNSVLMDRKKDGSVTVYPPSQEPRILIMGP